MNRTSPSSSLVRMAARSPARSSAGPDVTWSRDAHLGGDDAGQGGLAEPGRAGEEQVVGGLAPAAGGLQHDRRGAPSARPGRRTRRAAGAAGRPPRPARARRRGSGVEQLVTHAAPPSTREAPRAAEPVGVALGGQVAQRLADLVGAVAETGQRLAHVGQRGSGRAVARRRGRRRRRGRGRRGGALQLDAGAGPPSSCRRRARGRARRGRLEPHRGPQLLGRVDGEDGQGQRRPDAVGAEERLEAGPLVPAEEAVERLGVLADVVVDVEEDVVAEVAERGQRARA